MILRQQEILIGAVLGGSCLLKSGRLLMADRDERWLLYKMAELESGGEVKKVKNTYKCSSKKYFVEMYEKLYKDGKRDISMEILDTLHDIGLAVWFLDGGGVTGRNSKNIYLNTTKLDTEIVLEYFNSMGFGCRMNKNGACRRVVFGVGGSEKFLKIVVPCFPSYILDYLQMAS